MTPLVMIVHQEDVILRPALLQTRPQKTWQAEGSVLDPRTTFLETHVRAPLSSDDRYFVYILSNASRTLYIGVTNDLVHRVYQHKEKQVPGFTARYNVTQLVYYEEAAHPQVAIAREKELKGWRRSRKVALVSAANPTWRDLAEDEGFFTSQR